MERLGIDLGTTNTVAALGERVLALEPEGPMPSVVAFLPNGKAQMGSSARRRRAIDSRNTLFSSKRIIGRHWDDPETQEFRDRYPFEMCAVNSEPAFVTRAGNISPTDVAALLLSKITERLRRIPPDLDIAVTVPVGFNDHQRAATLQAATKAGLAKAHLIDEPVSAARAYQRQGGPYGTIGVYDLGGGTFDFAVLYSSGGEYRLLGSASDLFLGGDDIDHEIAKWVSTEILKQYNWDLANYPEVYDRLLVECEKAKVLLSSRDRAFIDIAQVDPDCPGAGSGATLGRDLLDELSDRLVRRSFMTCDHVLREVELRPQDLDAVVMAGGSTHLRMVKRGVEAYFGKPGLSEISPTEVVALGASLGRG